MGPPLIESYPRCARLVGLLNKRLFRIRFQAKLRAEKREKRCGRRRSRHGKAIRLAYVSTIPGTSQRIVQSKRLLVRQVRSVKIPRVFSIIDEPETALETLDLIRRISSNRSIRLIQIDHSDCEVLGLCASTAMDVILLGAEKRRPKSNPLSFSGLFSKTPSVNLMLRASGILRHLGLRESVLAPQDEQRIARCELFQGKSNRIEVGKERDRAATSLTDYFDGCLARVGHALTAEGKKFVSSLLTEIIGNAEEHGGPWSTIGHWQSTQGTQEQRLGECHIVILDYGNTIYESLDRYNESEQMREKLRTLSDLHRKQGFFSFGRASWDEETLWTLYALQERVSRYSNTPKGRDRGNGTISIIEFFNQLAGGAGRMCIASGRAFILFDGKYRLREMPHGDEMLKVIAFNADNDLTMPPDKEYVHRLENAFPGTIVSIRLKLDEAYLAKISADNGGNDA
jgi:hypothetical protein